MKTVFRIQRTSDKKFSTGGTQPTFKAEGKVWNKRGDVTSHLSQLHRYFLYQGCVVVVEYEVEETQLGSMSVQDWSPAASTIRAKELELIRQVEWKNELNRREVMRLEQQLAKLRKET